jgi:hypothetical protein
MLFIRSARIASSRYEGEGNALSRSQAKVGSQAVPGVVKPKGASLEAMMNCRTGTIELLKKEFK